MKRAIVIDRNDIVKILADYFGVSPESVIQSQESYTVIMEEEGRKREGQI